MSLAASEPAEAPASEPAAPSADQSVAPQTSEPLPPINLEESAHEPVLSPPRVMERTSALPFQARSASAPKAELDPKVEHGIFAVIAELRAVMARSVGSISDELASFARQSIDATAQTAIQMLSVKTWADAVAVNTNYARISYDHWLDSASKVSELGIKLAFESSKPLVRRMAKALSDPAR